MQEEFGVTVGTGETVGKEQEKGFCIHMTGSVNLNRAMVSPTNLKTAMKVECVIHVCHPSAWEAGIYSEPLSQDKTKQKRKKREEKQRKEKGGKKMPRRLRVSR